jgi:hypothetical protein
MYLLRVPAFVKQGTNACSRLCGKNQQHQIRVLIESAHFSSSKLLLLSNRPHPRTIDHLNHHTTHYTPYYRNNMDRKQAKAAWVSTLTKKMPLTALDYTAPQNYIMKCFGFPFDESERLAAIRHLTARFHLALKLQPCLGGQIIHGKEQDGKLSLPRLVYPPDVANNNLHTFPEEVFDHRVLDESQFPYTFERLGELGAPASAFEKHLLWLLPQSDPAPGDACHPVTLRASFIKGGLILAFAFHHGIMDGTGTNDFLNDFCLNSAFDYKVPPWKPSVFIGPRSIIALEQRRKQFNAFAREEVPTAQADARSMRGYDFKVPATPPTIPPAIAKIFTLSASRVTALHTAALAQIKSTVGPSTFISIADTICGLFWLHITRVRVRAGRIQPGDTTTLATAVNIRPDLTEVIEPGPGYVGNMFLRGLVRSEVSHLLQYSNTTPSPSELEQVLSSPAATAEIALAAFLVRDAVQSIANDRDGTRQKSIVIAQCATDPDPARNQGLLWPEVDAAVRRAISRHSTGVDVSVGVTLGADIEFDIPGAAEGGMKAAWVRRAYVPNEGFMGVLPRQGGAKGDADWEIWLGMREEDMDSLAEEGELGGWLCRPPA